MSNKLGKESTGSILVFDCEHDGKVTKKLLLFSRIIAVVEGTETYNPGKQVTRIAHEEVNIGSGVEHHVIVDGHVAADILALK